MERNLEGMGWGSRRAEGWVSDFFWEEEENVCQSRVPAWVGLTLTGPAQHVDEPKEEKGRQEEAYAILQRGPRETWQAEGARMSLKFPGTSPHTPPRFSIFQALTSYLQGYLGSAPQGGQAGVVDTTDIACPMLPGGDRGWLQVCREAHGAI